MSEPDNTQPDAVNPILGDPPLGMHRRRRRHAEAHAQVKSAIAGPRSDINVTPLVDVVLVLLIIFMVVTPLLHRGVQIELPQTANHEKKNDNGEQLVVSVRNDGVYVETERLEGEALTERFRSELKRSSRPVHVRADRALRFGDVRKVLNNLHDIGAANVGLGTEDK